jgi:hypothetical protein
MTRISSWAKKPFPDKVFNERHEGGGVSILLSNHVVDWIGFIGVSRDDGKQIIGLSKILADRNVRNSTGQRTRPDTIRERVFIDKMLLVKDLSVRNGRNLRRFLDGIYPKGLGPVFYTYHSMSKP